MWKIYYTKQTKYGGSNLKQVINMIINLLEMAKLSYHVYQ